MICLFEWGSATCSAHRSEIPSLPATSNTETEEHSYGDHWDSLKRVARLQSRWKFPVRFSFRYNPLGRCLKSCASPTAWWWELEIGFLPLEVAVKLYSGMRIREVTREEKGGRDGPSRLGLSLSNKLCSCFLSRLRGRLKYPPCWRSAEGRICCHLSHPYKPTTLYLTSEGTYWYPFLLCHLFVWLFYFSI